MEKKAMRRVLNTLLVLISGLSVCAWMFPAEPANPASELPAYAPLKGHVIAVDPGHGGYDGGARGPGGRWEKTYNLEIALRLQDYLKTLGATVVMTRDGDYALCDSNPKMRKKRQDMERRAALVLDAGAEMLISVHMNEYRDKGQSGPQVFFRADCPAGKTLAEHLQRQMIESLSPRKARAASTGDFYMLSLGIPSVLVECGFLSNAAEEALLRTDAYEERVAASIGDAVALWFSLEEKPAAAPRENR